MCAVTAGIAYSRPRRRGGLVPGHRWQYMVQKAIVKLEDDRDGGPACAGRKLGYWFWPGLSRGGPVLVEQSAQALPAPGPVDLGRERDHVRFVFGSTQKHSAAVVAAPGVVMGGADAGHVVQVAFCGDEDPAGAFWAGGADPALGEGVHLRGLRCGERDLDADTRQRPRRRRRRTWRHGRGSDA